MFTAIAGYEVRFHLSRPITWLYVLLFMAEGLVYMGTRIEVVGGAVGQAARNAPFSVAAAMLTFAAGHSIIVTGLIGTAVLRDYQYKTHDLLFTTPITKWEYLGGRFWGAFLVMTLVSLGLPLGLFIGSLVPWFDRTGFGPTVLWPYLWQFGFLVLPTLFLTTAIFFAVGALTRSLIAIYTQGLVLFVAWLAAGTLLANPDHQVLGALGDPFGIQAFKVLTRYWSVAEKSVAAIPAAGVLLANRLLWVGVGVAVMAVTYSLFRFRSAPAFAGQAKLPPPDPSPPPAVSTGPAPRRFDRAAWRAQVASSTRLAFRSIALQPSFVAIVLTGLVLLLVSSRNVDVLYSQPVWPLTYTVLDGVVNGFGLFFILVITIYAGEAVWRERQLKAHLVADALPTAPGVGLIGNLAGMVLVEAAVLAIFMAAGMAIQTVKGYTNYEVGLYLRYFFGITFPSLVQVTVLAFLVHAVVNQKFVGHIVMVLYWAGGILATQLGVGHPLLRYGQVPEFRYSDLNGFGPFVPEIALSALYWSGVAGLLVVGAYLLWMRGAETAWRFRGAEMRRRWNGTAAAMSFGSLALGLGAGGAIYYNTNVLHGYQSPAEVRARQVRYETTYRAFQGLELPRLVAVDVRADLEPERAAMELAGTFTFVNKRSRPLDSVLVQILHADLVVDTLMWDRPATSLVADSGLGVRIERLATPLAPGDTLRLRYRARYRARGFARVGPTIGIAANGTYFRRDWFPVLGYDRSGEMTDADERRKAGLPLRVPIASLADTAARANAYMLGHEADWIAFRATVSTAPDQIAVAPGSLVREYQEGGRRVFEYATDAPASNDYAIMSARYAVRRETYRGVLLEVLHHPSHTFNVDRMMAAMKASLDYDGANFGPYQFHQLRIVEFPRYAGYALALPGMVPFSESAGFILRPGTGPDALDLASYVTAHEVGHQWWGHQVAGADVEGGRWLSEGLANYAALSILERQYGQETLGNFLAYELDQYLLGRGGERGTERPIARADHDQLYILYNKGSLALFAYRDLIGEAAMNRALAKFREATAFKGPPYPTSLDLLRFLEGETPDSLRYAATDFFTTVTLWDLRAIRAAVSPRADGTYEVALRVGARKVRVDSAGVERDVPVGDLVDVGVFGDPDGANRLGKPLLVRKVWIRGADTTLTLVVREPPRRAGIDPYHRLIDRDRHDNLTTIGQ